MTARLLQALGVVFVLALVGGASFGFFVLKDRVRIVVAADAPAAGADPQALLRDDVASLARDFGALQQALARNFEQLGNALEERSSARHADVTAMRQDLADARLQLAALARDTARLQAQLASVAPGALPPAPLPTAESVPDAAAKQAPAAPAEPSVPATKGFLSFSVPATTFRFDELQDYVLIPELCRVGFDAKSTLHDFTGVTSQVKGGFRADFDDPEGAWTGEVIAQAAALATGVEGRDTNMREHLDTAHHTEIRFVVERFRPAPDGVDVAKQTVRGEVAGTMTIRGRSKPFAMPVAIEVDPQKRVVVKGQAPLKLGDYGVPVPSQLGLINMQDEVVVWIALRARASSGARK